ncbi:MAG: copper homeostasis protein CutC [Planctomycetota bacterium]
MARARVKPARARAELLCTDLASVEVACALGADRVELCGAVEVGGLTPSPGLLDGAVSLCAGGPEVVALVRPRAGGFELEGARELDALRRDVEAAGEAGADGVAIGVLGPDGAVDTAAFRALVVAAGSMRVTAHRALDHAPDLEAALQAVLDAGASRALTSGGAPTAWEGRAALRAAAERFRGRLELVAASGIRGGNAADVLAATGVGAIHGSCRTRSGAPPSRDALRESMAARGSVDGADRRWTLDRADARAFVRAAHGFLPSADDAQGG